MSGSSQHGASTFRTPWWALQALLGSIGLLGASTYFVDDSGDPVAGALGLVVGVISALVVFRAPRLERIDERLELGIYAPVLVLSDGQHRPLRMLAGYSTRRRAPLTRMARQASAIGRLRLR